MAQASCILFLIGMPAVGKTYWAKAVAETFDMQFADLDEYIVEQEGKSISEIFEQYGESGFRGREANALLQLINRSAGPLVIACGGGTPCYHDNLKQMKDSGTVVYLRAGLPLLLSRLQHSSVVRPLLQCKDPEAALNDLLDQRKNIYEQAHYIVEAETLSLPTFDKIILSCTNRH